jgi:hypothetical protein
VPTSMKCFGGTREASYRATATFLNFPLSPITAPRYSAVARATASGEAAGHVGGNAVIDLPKADWWKALAEMEHAIDQCLVTLQKYEDGFRDVLKTSAGSTTLLHIPKDDDGWNSRLETAQKHAHTVEELLREQETVWTQWKTQYENWRHSLEQPAKLTPGL